MTHAERRAMREKHQPFTLQELAICSGCVMDYPCDVIKVLDYLDVVDPMPTEINFQGGK